MKTHSYTSVEIAPRFTGCESIKAFLVGGSPPSEFDPRFELIFV